MGNVNDGGGKFQKKLETPKIYITCSGNLITAPKQIYVLDDIIVKFLQIGRRSYTVYWLQWVFGVATGWLPINSGEQASLLLLLQYYLLIVKTGVIS